MSYFSSHLLLFFNFVKSEIYGFTSMEIHGVGLDWVGVTAMSYYVSYLLEMRVAFMEFLVYVFGLILITFHLS